MNHVEFLRKLIARTIDTPTKGAPALGMWLAINYGAFEGAKALGIDATKWLFMSPAGYSLSPASSLVINALEAPEESAKGREARKNLLEFPLEMVPFGVELQNLYKGMDSGDLSMAKVLGFKEWQDPKQQDDLEDQFLFEMGLKK